jgi:hypothetical protein
MFVFIDFNVVLVVIDNVLGNDLDKQEILLF